MNIVKIKQNIKNEGYSCAVNFCKNNNFIYTSIVCYETYGEKRDRSTTTIRTCYFNYDS